MGYSLKILSPVHIGCGEQYNGLNFIVDGNKVYVMEPEAIIELLGPENGLKFAQWLDINTNEIAQINQDYMNKKKENPRSDETRKLNEEWKKKKRLFTLGAFVDKKNLTTIDKLRSKASYSVITQGGVFADSEIAPFLKQSGSPYIPGTEIKGSIRTGILYSVLWDDVNKQSWIKGNLEDFQRRNFRDINFVKNRPKLNKQQQEVKKNLANKLGAIEKVFQEEVFNCKPGDAKYDVLRFLQVGDSALLKTNSHLSVSYLTMLGKNFKIFYEFLCPGLSVPLTSFKLENEKARNKKLEKMEFTNSHKRLMSGLDPILSYCYRFSTDLLEEEIAYFNNHNKNNIVRHLREIQKVNTPQSPVLRIGKDEGFTSLTVGLAIKKLMPDLYENVLIHATRNKSYDSSITKDNFYFPKSRKIVHWDGKELTPGWVQLVSDDNRAMVEPNEAKTASTQTNASTSVDLSALAGKFGRTRR